MKSDTCFVLILLSTLLSARAEIQFRGVASDSKVTRLALVDTNLSQSRWVAVGDLFNGYEVAAYDATRETALLRKGSETLSLTLPEAAVKGLRLLPTSADLRWLEGMELAYALAAAGDEQVGEFIVFLSKRVATRLTLQKQTDEAEAELARIDSASNRQRLNDLQQKLKGAAVVASDFRWKVIEVAKTRRAALLAAKR